MTDLDALFSFRLEQARETLREAERMLQESFSARSVVNRAYYAVFYALLALFIKSGINVASSKHAGIITTFDREFIRAGAYDKRFSKMVHRLFDLRQEADYREFASITLDDAGDLVRQVREFISELFPGPVE
jgi:uncharacterized protein (UPF0332 family)